MNGFLVSATATVLQAALAQVSRPVAWPDVASGFAYRLFQAADLPLPPAFTEPLRPATYQILRRAPDLAAFGYVMAAVGPETQANWAQAFGHLMGRDVFPPDRNSFIHSPLELVGIALGISECCSATDAQRAWLASTIQRGFADRHVVDLTAQAAAACAEWIVSATTIGGRIGDHERLVKDLQIGDLAFLTSLAILVPDAAAVDVAVAEQEILSRVLSAPAPARDVAEAAGLYVALKRAIDRTVLTSRCDVDPVARIVALCRRFPLFVERLQARQRRRAPYTVEDEYDVQDLLHAILKLHFDDVRPEEWTPSYAGNSSRVDFLLPRERTIVEAKMTRPKLGQKEVTNELIIDIARYSAVGHVDNLVCLIYDRDRRCTNPIELEDDLARTGGRLYVAPVVCPSGA